MSLDLKVITTTMIDVMKAFRDAEATGISFIKPDSIKFQFPLTSGSVEFDVRMNWYGITPEKEDELWGN